MSKDEKKNKIHLNVGKVELNISHLLRTLASEKLLKMWNILSALCTTEI